MSGLFLVAALAGCAGSSSHPSQSALFQPASKTTLTCTSVFADGNTLKSVIGMLAADDNAIGGQWATAEAEATGDVNGTATPTAAQSKASNDLTSALRDLDTASQAKDSLATTAATLDTDANRLTNGTPDWQSAGPAVSADIAALETACGSNS
jgi:hypothetical protein